MDMYKNNHSIDSEIRSLISKRYKTITKAINGDFWFSDSETNHSRYVGSYGRCTAINVSDIDVLFELPNREYEHFKSLAGNGPSRLLQAVKSAIKDTYSRTDIHGDGQVVVVNFSDGMKFEILPAFRKLDYWGDWDGTYIYPDSNMGGNWLSTQPKAEQDAMAEKNDYWNTNGLLFDTCKHIRYLRSEYFSSYHLSGILIDSFVYSAIGGWHWTRENEQGGNGNGVSYERSLLDYYDSHYRWMVFAPGSGSKVDGRDWDVLGKVLKRMAQ